MLLGSWQPAKLSDGTSKIAVQTEAREKAADFPSFNLGEIQVPCLTNPLGVKGAGESGTVGAPPAVIHAILDALAPLGVETIDMPATPERVWRAMQKAKGA